MKILLADPDRDLLSGYRDLLMLHGHEVCTSFDGTHVIRLLGEQLFDFAILDRNLPRVDVASIVALLRQERIPHILLVDRPARCGNSRQPEANACLAFPFTPGDLLALISAVAEKARSGQILEWGDMQVDISAFRFCDEETDLTNDEIDLLRALIAGQTAPAGRSGSCVVSLNGKLRQLHKKSRITYVPEKGYQLVRDHE